MSKNDLVQSVTRALDLLEMVGRSENGLTLQEIARSLGVQPPTAHNMARTLVARGYLQKSRQPIRYQLGSALFGLVDRQAKRDIRSRAGAEMQKLAADFPGATITLVESRSGDLQVMLRISPEMPGIIQRPPSQTMNGYISAAGLVFQAYWTASERADFRRRCPFEEFGANAWNSIEQFDDELSRTRTNGFATPAIGNLFRVSVPLFNHSNALIAAIGISMPGDNAAKIDEEKIINRLKTASRVITATEGI
jgi:DNA-binding IclR family transcriptional regulator